MKTIDDIFHKVLITLLTTLITVVIIWIVSTVYTTSINVSTISVVVENMAAGIKGMDKKIEGISNAINPDLINLKINNLDERLDKVEDSPYPTKQTVKARK